MIVRNAVKPSVYSDILENIKELMMERSLMNVRNVVKASVYSVIL